MADDFLPIGSRAIFAFLETIALGFVVESAAAFVNGKPWYSSAGWLAAAVVFGLAGIKWPQIKRKVLTM